MNELLLAEKYRPKKVDDCILPKAIKEIANKIVQSDTIPNLMMTGSAGVGKSSLAKVLVKELDYEYLFINASEEGRSIDTLRTTITDFATGTSLSGKKKVVILDEFDGTTDVVQKALRGFFEQYSVTCSFILTANNLSKIDAPIISRFSPIEFKIPSDEKGTLAVEFAKRLMDICDIEGIKYEKKAIAELVKMNFPDFRKTLNDLQLCLLTKTLDMESIKSLKTPTDVIFGFLKEKNFKELRKTIALMSQVDVVSINRDLWALMDEKVTPQSVPMLVLIMNDYNYKSSFCLDMEVCIMAEFVEILSQVEFK